MTEIEKNDVYKGALVGILKKLLPFFDKNNLQYWAAAGTCLGAVRHNNVIPWDDDIDILMPSSDYFRLFEYSSQLKDIGLNIISSQNAPIAMSYMKIVDANSTVWEQRYYPLTGVWVDIFPVFYSNVGRMGAGQNDQKFQRIFKKFQRGMLNYNLIQVVAPLRKLDFADFFNRLLSVTYYRMTKNKHRKDFIGFQSLLNNEKQGTNIICYRGVGADIWNSSWFAEYKEVPFADIMIKIPIGYHEYLQLTYGAYEELPPEGQRHPHKKLFVNLKESLTKKEVKKRLREGQDFEY